MKKKLFLVTTASVLTMAFSMQAFAGTWKQGAAPNESRWWYDNGNGTWAANGWYWLDSDGNGVAECYYFDADGWLLTNTVTPDNYQVDSNGAWVVNGVVQTQGTEATSIVTVTTETGKPSTIGWIQEGSLWRYYTGTKFCTEEWRKIDGTKYYFDEESYMVTGFQEIDDNLYYFNNDGALKTKDFTLDGTRYIVDDGGVIEYEIDVEDYWYYYSSSSSSTSSSSSSSSSSGSSSSNSSSSSIIMGSSGSSSSSSSNSNYSNSSTQTVAGHNYDYAMQVWDIVNEERAKEGKSALEWDEDISELTTIRAEELASSYSHTRPDGQSFYSVFSENDMSYRSCGENIAAGQKTPEIVMNAWMNSTGHRNNILKDSYTHMAVGCYTSGGRTYWVQLFASY